MNSFHQQLAALPACEHLAAIELADPQGVIVARIANAPGSTGSLRVYHALAARFGAITSEAAAAGLVIFAEHTEHARNNPGSHPNIDRLFALAAGELPVLAVREVAR